MSDLQTSTDEESTQILFKDCSSPQKSIRIEETAWLWPGKGDGKEEAVLRLEGGNAIMYFAQSDIQELLPYFERFAKTGKMAELPQGNIS